MRKDNNRENYDICMLILGIVLILSVVAIVAMSARIMGRIGIDSVEESGIEDILPDIDAVDTLWTEGHTSQYLANMPSYSTSSGQNITFGNTR